MRIDFHSWASRLCSKGAFSLEEVVFSMAIASVAVGGILSGHNLSYRQSMWSAASTAAQASAVQRLEQVRAAKWDPLAEQPVDEVLSSQFPLQILPLPSPNTSTNVATVTNRTTITLVTANPPVKLVKVDATWMFAGKVFTNSVFSYRSPDQ